MAKRRIGGASGGSDKGSGGGVAVLAIGMAVAISAGGVTATVSASTTSGTSGSVGSSSGSRSKSQVSDTDSSSAEARLTKQGFRIAAKTTNDATDCVGHSYGQAQNFFRREPCVALHRALFEVHDPKGDVVLVAVAWVQMPDGSSARALKSLLDSSGTGNMTELSREQGKYRTVRYTGDAYASRLDGTVVINAQAQPVLRGAAGLALTSLVTNAVG